MTLEQLRIFVGVAEREHVTRAAEALNVTQSAASGAIAALEARHGVKLFDRVGRGIALTEAGRLFLAEARAVLARAAQAETVLGELGALERGTLTLVASQTIAAYWLPPILAAFHRTYPALGLTLQIANTQQAARRVREGEADLGIVEGLVEDPALARWTLGQDRLVLVRAAPFGPETIDAPWLRAAPWVLREEGSGTRSAWAAHMRELGLDPEELDVHLTLPSNESVRTAVEAGAGLAALSALVVAPALASGTLHAAPLAFPARPFFALRHKERYRTRAAEAFLSLVESWPERSANQGAGCVAGIGAAGAAPAGAKRNAKG